MSLAVAAVAAATPGAIKAPSIEYSQLAPMLVVFGAAVIGVLVEAFVPRELRRALHLLVTLGALVAAFVWTCVIAASSTLFAKDAAGHVAAMGVYPKPVLDVINPAVKATMSQVGSVDPVPAHPAAAPQNGTQP